MIYIVIPVFNRWIFTKACLSSLLCQDYRNFEIIVVDHGSSDGTSDNIGKLFPKVIVLKGDDSMWWTAATNLGVKYALKNGAEFIITLNNDLVVDTNYLSNLISSYKLHPNSLIGSVSLNIDDRSRIVYAGTKWNVWTARYFPSIDISVSYDEISHTDVISTDLLPGRGTLIPSDVFRKIGYFNEVHFPHYMADEDFSLNAKRQGYSLLVSTKAIVYSHVDDTGLNKLHKKKDLRYLKDTFTSIRSPNKISVRWHFAKHAPVPLLYFVIDFGRVFASQLLKTAKLK